jgi:hypothetical protein
MMQAAVVKHFSRKNLQKIPACGFPLTGRISPAHLSVHKWRPSRHRLPVKTFDFSEKYAKIATGFAQITACFPTSHNARSASFLQFSFSRVPNHR